MGRILRKLAVTRQLIQHITENKAFPKTKYKTLPHPKDTVERANIKDKIHQLNQQIEVMVAIDDNSKNYIDY